jgi:hypothetical protein
VAPVAAAALTRLGHPSAAAQRVIYVLELLCPAALSEMAAGGGRQQEWLLRETPFRPFGLQEGLRQRVCHKIDEQSAHQWAGGMCWQAGGAAASQAGGVVERRHPKQNQAIQALLGSFSTLQLLWPFLIAQRRPSPATNKAI